MQLQGNLFIRIMKGKQETVTVIQENVINSGGQTSVLVMELRMPTEKAPQERSTILRDEVLRPSFSCKAQENQLKLARF